MGAPNSRILPDVGTSAVTVLVSAKTTSWSPPPLAGSFLNPSAALREAIYQPSTVWGSFVAMCVSDCWEVWRGSERWVSCSWPPSWRAEVADRSLEDGVSDDVREALVNDQVGSRDSVCLHG